METVDNKERESPLLAPAGCFFFKGETKRIPIRRWIVPTHRNSVAKLDREREKTVAFRPGVFF